MTDHALLVPTSIAPIGAIVSEPMGDVRGALVMLPGDGRPGRSGVNGIWSRMARGFADQGLLVLRFDFVGEGDGTMIPKDAVPNLVHKGWLDLMLLQEVVAWWRERIGRRKLMVVGECLGGQIAIAFALRDPEVVGAFLSVPYVRARFVESAERSKPAGRVRRALGQIDREDFDPDVLDALPKMLERGPVWMLRGDKDGDEALQLKRLLGPKGRRLEVEVARGIALHPVSSPEVQREVTQRLTRRVLRAVDEAATRASDAGSGGKRSADGVQPGAPGERSD